VFWAGDFFADGGAFSIAKDADVMTAPARITGMKVLMCIQPLYF
jgi:hypothetical protein